MLYYSIRLDDNINERADISEFYCGIERKQSMLDLLFKRRKMAFM